MQQCYAPENTPSTEKSYQVEHETKYNPCYDSI